MIDMTTTDKMLNHTRVIIPARLQSGRLPNKLLQYACGKSLLQWTHERAKQLGFPVMVLTSDHEILKHCYDYNMTCLLRPCEAKNGTQRIAEYVSSRHIDEESETQWIINWQADEPLIEIEDVQKMMNIQFGDVLTLVAPIGVDELSNPNVTKAAFNGIYCHWFSRAAMAGAFGHCGIYMYSLYALRTFHKCRHDKSFYAEQESLEQLTWIENEYGCVRAAEIEKLPLSINTSADWVAFKMLKEKE